MKQKYFTFHFVDVNYDLIYETDGEDKSETIKRVRKDLRGRRLADLRMGKMVPLIPCN